MAHYIFNTVSPDEAARFLEAGIWGVGADEPHGGSLARGDIALVYLAAPERAFIGRVEVASAVHDGGVSLAHVERWDPPVRMSAVLAQIDPSEEARADFDTGVVRITEGEYETALAVAAAS